MYKYIAVLIVIFGVGSGASSCSKAGRSDDSRSSYSSVLFYDDFESETRGELPSQWTVRYSGNTLETVSSPVYAGNRAFMLQGAPSWVGSVTHDIDIQGDFVLEAYVYVPSGGLGRENQGGIAYNDGYMVKFTKNSSSTFQLRCRGTSYGSYSCNTWYKIELRVDSESERFKVYLDGNYILTENAGNFDSRGIELSSSNLNDAGAQRTVYFDNIKVTESDYNYSSADIVFSDDFESETRGELPSQWTVRYSGNTLETVSSPVYAGNRAFMLQGAPSWVGSVTHDIDIQGDFVLEAYIYVPSGGLGRENQGGLAYNDGYMVKFTKNSSSTFQLRCRGTSYGSYSCNTWYRIELRVDSESERFKVYLDGNYILTENAGNFDSRGIELSSSNLNDAGAQRTVYFDNIKVTRSSFSY